MFRKLHKTKFPDSEEKALAYALRILSMRWYGEKEMHDRILTKGFEEKVAQSVLSRLSEFGYINDDNRLESKLSEYRDFGTYGRKYIEQKLLEKKYSKQQLDQAFDKHWSKEIELGCAKRFGEKQKLPVKELDYKTKQKFLAKFLRRGFAYDVAMEVVSS